MQYESNADYPKYLEPGQTLEWRTRGDFWFVKQGTNLKVTAFKQTSTNVLPGDKKRYMQPFEFIEVKNNASYTQLVNIVIGFGDFDRNIVNGNVYSISGLLDAQGNTYHDDRITEAVNLAITDTGGFSWTKNQVLNEKNVGFGLSTVGGYYDAKKDVLITFVSNGSDDYRLVEFDRKTLAVVSQTADLDNVSGFNYFSVDPYRQYAYKAAQPNTVYIGGRGVLASEMTQVAIENNTGITGINGKAHYDYIDDVTYIFFTEFSGGSSNYCYCTVKNGAFSEMVALDNQAGIVGGEVRGILRLSESEKLFVFATDGGTKNVDLTNNTIIDGDTYGNRVGNGSAYHFGKNIWFSYPKVGAQTTIEVRALKSKSYKGLGFVSVGDCAPLQILNQDAISKLSANVTLTQVGERLVKVEGEVIKAILELYAAKVGGSVPTDYLDYIYAIKGAGLNVASGNESFKRVGQADDFSLLSPAGLSITFSKRLLS